MEKFIVDVNSNSSCTFRVKLNKDFHNSNGPNAFPIIIESKKKGKDAIADWYSDCRECRLESSERIGTSAGNLLFANFNKPSVSPEILVQNKKSSSFKRLLKGPIKNQQQGDTTSSQEVKGGSTNNDDEEEGNSNQMKIDDSNIQQKKDDSVKKDAPTNSQEDDSNRMQIENDNELSKKPVATSQKDMTDEDVLKFFEDNNSGEIIEKNSETIKADDNQKIGN